MDAWNLALNAFAGSIKSAGGDVERLVMQGPLAVNGGFEQKTRLVRGARAQLGNAQACRFCPVRVSGMDDDFAGMCGEDSTC